MGRGCMPAIPRLCGCHSKLCQRRSNLGLWDGCNDGEDEEEKHWPDGCTSKRELDNRESLGRKGAPRSPASSRFSECILLGSPLSVTL